MGMMIDWGSLGATDSASPERPEENIDYILNF